MRFARRWAGKLGFAAGVAGALAFCPPAWAQGCVMCYTSASALNNNAAHELDKAIIVLFIPPVLMFLGIFAYIYKRRAAWRAQTAPETFSAFDSGRGLEPSPRAQF